MARHFEIGIPNRIIVDEERFKYLVNKYNGIKNIYRSVYNYEELKDSKINPESVILDKVFFDFDGKESYDETVKLHKFLSEKKLIHDLRFSGGGFHIFLYLNPIKLKNPKLALLNIHNYFYNMGFKFDKQIIGDISRLCRVPNTFNVRRGYYCIYISKKELLNGWDFLRQKAKKQYFKKWVYGKNLFEIGKFDAENGKYEILKIDNDTKIKIDKDKLLKTFPPCIANMLLEGELKYRQRFYVLSYLINRGFNKNEIKDILKAYLKPERFNHIITKEKHIEYMFKKDALFPSCRQIKGEGLCPIQGICKQIKKLYR